MPQRSSLRSSAKTVGLAALLCALLLAPSLGFLVIDRQEPLAWALVEVAKDVLLVGIAAFAFYRLGAVLPSRSRGESGRARLALLDSLPDPLAMFDTDERLTYANEAFRERCRGALPATRAEAVFRLGAEAVLRESSVGTLVLVPMRRDAEEADGRGRPSLERLAEAVPLPVIVSGYESGLVRVVNAKAARLLGISPDDDPPMASLIEAADWAKILEAIRQRGECLGASVRIHAADGAWADATVSVGAARAGQEALLVVLVHQNRAVPADAARLRSWLTALIRNSLAEVFVIDRGGRVAAILHATVVDQAPLTLFDVFVASAREDLAAALARAVAGESPVELQARSESGDVRLVRLVPVKSGRNKVEDLVAIVEPAAGPVVADRLREIEQRSRRLFFDNPLPQLLVDPETGVVAALNAAARAFYGYQEGSTPRFADIDQQGLKVLAPLGDGADEDGEIAYRSLHVSTSGIGREVEVRGRALAQDGRRLAYLVVNDITDVRRASEALRESEARFRAVFEHGPVGIAILDQEDRLVRANPAFQDMLSYSQESLRTLFFSDLAHPDDRAVVERRLDFSNGSGDRPETVESRFICRDGKILWADLSAALQRDDSGRPQFVIVMISDIGERKSAEQALRMSEERLRAIIDNSPAMITVLDRQGRHLLVNARFVEFTGLSEAEVQGKTVDEFLADPETAERGTEDNRRVVATGEPVTREEVLRSGRGEERLFVTVKFPLFAPDGAIYGICGIATDVTEHRQTEESLRQAQKMEAIGQLTGGVAHDFNNLLTVVQGNLEWLAEKLAADESGRRLVDTALEASRLGSTLTQRLLAFSRKQPLKPETINLQEAVLRMDPLLVRTLGETIALETKIPGGLWRVRVDPQQLENSLLNLAVNARDAMPAGGKLTIELANETMAPKNRRQLPPGDYVRIEVADTGSGMAPETIRRAFEPFFTTKEKGKGTGLGLSMVYGFVRQSGGDIDIDSTRGKGSRIIIRLPRVTEEAVARTAALDSAGEALPKGSENVLVVEDDPRVRRLAVGILEWLGYAVLEADDGPSAVELLEDNDDVDIVFTDVVMPGGMSGFDVARKAAEMEPGIKVLFTSGYSHEEMSRVGVVPNEIAMLPKPYTRRELAKKIREVLDSEGR